MAIPNELNKDINALPETSNRLLVRALVLSVIALFSGLMLLYRVGVGDKKSAISDAKEQAVIYKKENDYLKAELRVKDRIIQIKDSLNDDCAEKRVEEAQETRQSIRQRVEKTVEIKKLLKKQQ